MDTIWDVLRRLAELLGHEGHAEALKIINREDPAHPEGSASSSPEPEPAEGSGQS